MGNIIGKSGTIVVILLVVILIGVLFMPQIRQWMLNLRAEEITISDPAADALGPWMAPWISKLSACWGETAFPPS